MLKVLYDISLLGIAYRNRTTFGLSRTTAHLLRALLDLPHEVRLAASSDVSFNVWLFSRLYWQQQPFCEAMPWFSDAFNASFKDTLREWWLKDALFAKQVALFKRLGLIKDETQVYRWRNEFMELGFHGTPRRRLADVNLYHSNYHRIPEQIQQHSRVKAVLTVHDMIPILHPEWCGMLGGADKYFHPEFDLPATLKNLNRDNWIICPSAASRHDVCNYLGAQIDPDKVRVIPWAASELFYPCTDPERLRAVREKYKLPPTHHYLLSLSTIEPRKNLPTLLRSFHRLLQQERMSDLYLVLAGAWGWDYGEIFIELRKSRLLASRVILPGHIADADLAALYSGALGFVFPSLYEGFGLPPLEAMQCGTPVLTSDMSSLPEVVGNAGLLVNPRDEEALAQSLLTLYQDADLRAVLSRCGIARAAMFNWANGARDTVKVYREAWGS
jgi:glycosyltransferase involved in cell wall biosynthesis